MGSSMRGVQGLVSLCSARKSRMGRKEGAIWAGGCALAGIGGLGWGSRRGLGSVLDTTPQESPSGFCAKKITALHNSERGGARLPQSAKIT